MGAGGGKKAQPPKEVVNNTGNTDTVNQPEKNNTSNSINQSEDSLGPLNPSKMSKKHHPPTRTLSVLKQEDNNGRLQRNPQMKPVLAEFANARLYLESFQNEPENDDYEKLHEVLNKKIIDKFSSHATDEQRLLMGDHLAQMSFHKPLLAVYGEILEDQNLFDGISPTLDDEDGDESYYEAIVDIRTIIWNFSDISKEFASCVAKETDMFQWLVKDLKCTFKEGVHKLTSNEFSFNSAVAIITNCGRAGLNKSAFNVLVKTKESNGEESSSSVHMVDLLTPFLKSKEQFVKLTTLLALSYMVNDDQCRFLTADESLFDFLLDMISKSLENKQRRHSGFSAHELIDGLAGLAKSDENKLKIMEKKATFPMLKKSILQQQSEDETLAAVRAVWELAFAKKNKEIFAKDKKLMSQLESLQNHSNQDIANSAGRTRFVIDPDNTKNLMKPVDDTKSNLDHPEQEHIMISYQWGNQKTILQIRDKLRENNFPVWVDVDFMEGSILQMMASAIEKASVVLVCYSEKYRDSKNCRTEAEYAFTRDKFIIPLLLENRYRPDGWLGILIGAKKFYDFSGKYDFDKKFYEMRNELDGLMRQKKRLPSNISVPQQPGPISNTAPVDEEIILMKWTKSDVEEWLEENKLKGFSNLKSLSGEQIGFLYKLFRRAPDYFYKCLEDKLGLKSLEDLMKFDRALEKLSRDHPDINKLL